MENIVVMFGGKSFEHDVSIITGLQIINNLNSFKYKVYPVYITKNGDYLYGEKLKQLETYKHFDASKFKKVYLKPNNNYLYVDGFLNKKICKVDAIVLGTHGGNGEDGTLSAVLDETKIPYTASGLTGSVLAMDKALTKYVLENCGVDVLPYKVLNRNGLGESDAQNLPDFPLVVKPARLGSSIGVTMVKDEDELSKALEVAFTLDSSVVVEKALTNFYELNIALFKNRENIEFSEIEKPMHKNGILTFENKYIENESGSGMENCKREFPAQIDSEMEERVKDMALKSFDAFSLSGLCRIDFLIDETDGKLYLNEINAIPGSLAFYLFKNKFTFSELLDELIENAKLNVLEKNNKLFNFESSILDNVNLNGTKK